MNSNSTFIHVWTFRRKLKTHRSGSQDDMNRSTSDCVFWKMNPDSGRQRGIGGEKVNEGMRSKAIGSWWNTKHYSTCSSAWTDHGGSWLTGSSTRYQYYWHIQYNYSTQPQYFRWDNFHYSMYSKYCNTCCTPSNSLLLNWFVAK